MEHQNTGISGFKLFTIISATLSFFIVNFVFLYDPWTNPSLYPAHYALFFSCLYSTLFLLWTWAYILTIRQNKTSPKSVAVIPIQTGQTDGRCEKCRISKPERAHHCSTCNVCVEKMDHHCVWTDRCIGYRNYKTFLQFIGYLSIGTFFYDYLAISFFLNERNRFGLIVVVAIYLETAIVFLTTLLANSLFVAHLFMASINLSTIEYMQGKPFRLFWKQNLESVRVT